MQVLAEVVALHQTSGITAAQAEACAAMATSKMASIIQSQGSAVRPAPATTPVLKSGASTHGQASPVTPKLILPGGTPGATPQRKDAATPATADAKDHVSPGRNNWDGAGRWSCPLQPCTLRACTHQLASLLQYASLHVLRAASARPSHELAQVSKPSVPSECTPPKPLILISNTLKPSHSVGWIYTGVYSSDLMIQHVRCDMSSHDSRLLHATSNAWCNVCLMLLGPGCIFLNMIAMCLHPRHDNGSASSRFSSRS